MDQTSRMRTGPTVWRRWLPVCLVLGAVGPQWGCQRVPRLGMPGFPTSFSWRQKAETWETAETESAPEASVRANVAKIPDNSNSTPGTAKLDNFEWAKDSLQEQASFPQPPERSSDGIQPSNSDDPFAAFGIVTTAGVTAAPNSSESTAGQEVTSEQNSNGHVTEIGASATSDEGTQKLEQLRAALTADAQRANREQEHAVVMQPLRVRAESLLERATELYRMGYLLEARRTAQQAVELSDTGRIEYLPTEIRPHDLLTQIDREIQSTWGEGAQSPLASSTSAMPPAIPQDVRTFSAQPQLVQESAIGKVSAPELTEVAVVTNSPNQPLAVRSRESAIRAMANRPTELSGMMAPLIAQEEGTAAHRGGPELTPLADISGSWPSSPTPVSTSSEGSTAAIAATVAATDAAAFPELPLPELPPFRGDTARPETAASQTLSQAVAPAPPSVEDLEPLPNVRRPTAAAFVTELPGSEPLRPIFSRDSLIWALAMVGMICAVVGCGLTIRRLRELA